MEMLSCICGKVVKAPKLIDFLGMKCPYCSSPILNQFKLARILYNRQLVPCHLRPQSTSKENLDETTNLSYTSESLSNDELSELEELNDSMNMIENSTNESNEDSKNSGDKYITSLPTS